jgi:hypothetical protein
MVMSMKVIGRMIKQMDMVSLNLLMVQSMKVFLRMINMMDMV